MSATVTFLFTAVILMAGSCQGEIFNVGDESGWTSINITADFYSNWASSKDFNIGDILLFKYYKNYHTVVRVTSKNFDICNATEPLSIWSTGNDSFVIPGPGHFYFLCGMPGHCEAGQKIDIRVSGVPSPSSSPSVSPENYPTSCKPSGSYVKMVSWKVWFAAVVAAFAMH